MSKRTLGLIGLGILTLTLFLNRSNFSLSLQNLVLPFIFVGGAVWIALRLGWWEMARSLFATQATYFYKAATPQNGSPGDDFDFDDVNSPPRAAPPPPPMPAATRAMAYTIRLPKDTQWRPELGVSLVRSLVSVQKLALRIVAENHEIRWQVLDFQPPFIEPSLIIKAIRDVYPTAEVVAEPYSSTPFKNPFYRMVEFFKQNNDFIFPISYPNTFSKTKGDPLTLIANVMNDLEPGERISYTLYLGQIDQKLYTRAKSLYTRSNWELWQVIAIIVGFATIIGSVVSIIAIFYKLVIEKKPEKYVTSDMNLIYEKIGDMPLLPAMLVFEANSPRQERLAHFDIQPALLQFASDVQHVARVREVNQEIAFYVGSLQQAQETDAIAQIQQRLAKPVNRVTNVFCPSEVASLWHLPHEDFVASNISWVRGVHVPLPSAMQGGAEGGVCLGDNMYGGVKRPVYMLPEDRAAHLIVVGRTGMGKSTLLYNLIKHDIEAGRGVAVIDPSPRGKNIVPLVLRYAIPDQRKGDVVILDLSDRQTPPPLNILSVPPYISRMDNVANIRAIFEKVYGSDFSQARMGRTLGMIVHALLNDPTPTARDVQRLLRDSAYRQQLTEELASSGAQDFWDRFSEMKPREQDEYFEPILGRLEVLYDSDLLYPVVCHPDPLDLGSYIRDKKIILISLAPPENVGLAPSEQALLGSILVSQFQLAVMAQRPAERFFLYLDEAQHFVTTSLPELFNEARGQNLSLTLSNQFLKQLTGSTLQAVMGNLGALISFQIGTDDASTLAELMKPRFNAHALLHLEVHQAAALVRHEGRQQEPFSLVCRPGANSEFDFEAEEREAEIRALSRSHYIKKSREEVLQWLKERYPRKKPSKSKAEGGSEEEFSDPLS